MFKLVHGIGPGQITSLVLKCPACDSYNDIDFIPTLEKLVAEIIAAPDPIAKVLALKTKLETVRDHGTTSNQVTEAIHADSEALAKLLSLVEPKSAGDFYSMLGCIIAFLAFLATLKQISTPAVVINQYISAEAAPPISSRGAPCPCGSGKKFKRCHGRKK